MRTDYVPNPIDTSGINIPEELKPLIEKMAENIHEVWSKNRMEQGWSYGPQRDDVNKRHPCLVPYDCLPEDEKFYDRETLLETLKLIIRLKFKISPN